MLIRKLVIEILVFFIRIYQVLLSPLLGQNCRFEPSCSRYTVLALRTHGPFRGLKLSLGRILRCHPGHPGGPDPVPPFQPSHSSRSYE